MLQRYMLYTVPVTEGGKALGTFRHCNRSGVEVTSPSGTCDSLFASPWILFRQLQVCYYGHLLPLKEGSLIFICVWALFPHRSVFCATRDQIFSSQFWDHPDQRGKLGVGYRAGVHNQILVIVENLQFFFLWGILLDERGLLCNLLVQVLLSLASTVAVGSESRRTLDHILLASVLLPLIGHGAMVEVL
jgi:hypothetical protein